jgi:hypothetical protein
MNGNRHAADRLHDVRAEIRTLEAEAHELQSYLQQHPDGLEGDEYQASIGSYQRRYIDLAGIAREIGKATLQRFTSLKSMAVLRLRERRERKVA